MLIKKIDLARLCMLVLLIPLMTFGTQEVFAYGQKPEDNPYGPPGSGPGGAPTGQQSRVKTIEFFNGQMRMKIQNLTYDQLRIKTPVAVIGVRGTEFFLEHKGNTTTVIVYEGQVELADKNEETKVLVNPGEQSTATGIPSGDVENSNKGFSSADESDTDQTSSGAKVANPEIEEPKAYTGITISRPKTYSPEKLEGLAAVELPDEWAEADVVTLNHGDSLESEGPTRARTSTGSVEIMVSPGTNITYTEESQSSIADLYWKLGVVLFLIASAAVIAVLYVRHRKLSAKNGVEN